MSDNLKLKFSSWLVGIFIGLLLGLLFGIIINTIFRGLTSPPLSVEQLTMLTTTIMALATIILAIITGLYAKTTHDILSEQKKSEEIRFIEKKLEKLYIPLNFCLKNNSEIKLKTFSVKDLLNIKKCLEKINPYSYLASSKLRFPLDSFIEIIEKGAPIIVEAYFPQLSNC